MTDVIEVSYTGDLLAHRRCRRAWAYEKYAGFHPYEQVQAMEGRLVHHAMEWLTKFYGRESRHADRTELETQLKHYFRVLWARGIRTAFSSKQETINRVLDNLFPPLPASAGPNPGHQLHLTLKAAIEGAQHAEYELRTVRKLLPLQFDGKKRLVLTGILDLVVQQASPLYYPRSWQWTDKRKLEGAVIDMAVQARPNDVEIWDYKATRSSSPYLRDYVLQLLTYANLYTERTGVRPARCVLFFINEPTQVGQLLALPLEDDLLEAAFEWTLQRVRELQQTSRAFRTDPASVIGGDGDGTGCSVSASLADQCTACGFRFDCSSYRDSLGGDPAHPDIELTNVLKN